MLLMEEEILKTDLDAIQKITKSVTGTAMNWKEYSNLNDEKSGTFMYLVNEIDK